MGLNPLLIGLSLCLLLIGFVYSFPSFNSNDEKAFHQYIIDKFKLNFIREGSKNNKYHTNTGAKVSLSHELYDNAAETKCNKICKICANNSKCVEGAYALRYALRIDEIGDIKPCLENPILCNIRDIKIA